MKKILTLIISIMCIIFLSLSIGCSNKNTNDNNNDGGKVTSYGLQGEYLIDGTSLGMPMKWYMKVTEDNKFQISTDRTYGTDKGHGTIAKNNETYVLVYSDSTNENAKTATFTVVDGSFNFSTKLYIGDVGMASENQYPVAEVIAYENLLGEYVSTYTSVGSEGTVNYDLSLTLLSGKKYDYVSTFAMRGSTYKYEEVGTFNISDNKVSLTAKQKVTSQTLTTGILVGVESPVAKEGTIDTTAKTIQIILDASPMKQNETDAFDFVFGTTSEVAGTYTSSKKIGASGSTSTVLNLGKTGTFNYTNTTSMMGQTSTYSEKGTFTYADGKVVLTSTHKNQGESDIAMTENNTTEGTIIAKKSIVATIRTGGQPSEQTLYCSTIIGTFTADNSDENVTGADIIYATLKTNIDGTYTLTTKKLCETPNVIEGTFTVDNSTLMLKYNDGAKSIVCMISGSSINAQKVPVDNENTSGFAFSKNQTTTQSVVGNYEGSYVSASGMGGSTTYTISLELKQDNTYSYSAAFAMGGTNYTYLETGIYDTIGDVLAIKATQQTTNATIEAGILVDISLDKQVVYVGTYGSSIKLTKLVSCFARTAVEIELSVKASE